MLKRFCTFFVLSFFSLMSSAATLNQAVNDCSVIKNSLKRLVCYDNISKKIQQFDEEILVNKVTPKATPLVTPSEGFGLENRLPKESAKLTEIVSSVVSVKENTYDEMLITLDNQQVWKQIGDNRFTLNIGDDVIIKRASLGSFLLTVIGRNKQLRVKRLK